MERDRLSRNVFNQLRYREATGKGKIYTEPKETIQTPTQPPPPPSKRNIRAPPSYKKGGKVKQTGLALVHKGEVVIPANRVKSVDSALKKSGKKPLKK